ncbi:peptide deformylase 1 [Actinomycetota bacterium]|nr:peptide deformylase 1 [Actinomycetota bacterium]
MPSTPSVPSTRNVPPGQRLRDQALRLIEAARAEPGGTVPIVQAGHPVLRGIARPYDGELTPDELTALLRAMRLTMLAAPGVGLAAPQIGLSWALAVVHDPGTPDPEVTAAREREPLEHRVLVNPRYEAVGDERVSFYEGCLSVVGYQAVVPRARVVRLTGQDQTGRALDELVTGWQARIVQHETDHLAGTLYIDRAHIRSLSATDELGAYWGAQPHPEAAARALGFPLGS